MATLIVPAPADDTARRVADAAAVLAAIVIAVHVFAQMMPRAPTAVPADPVARLVALLTVLMAVGVIALQRYRIVAARSVPAAGMVLEVTAAFSVALVETSHPFGAGRPFPWFSAVGPLMLIPASLVPTPPRARLFLALAAATAWPVAHGLNAARFSFFTESWRPVVLAAATNYLLVPVAFMIARSLETRVSSHAGSGSADPDERARELGSYQLLGRIGDGGMGEVWRARHKLLARPAAIKFVKFEGGREELFAQRFHREANAIAGLQSPHTVYLFDYGTTPEGRLYYAMELLEGISLQTLVATYGPQPPSRVVAILRQICRSLEEAHQKQIVHRDLKPSNVMLCRVAQTYDFVKVLDFGLAKILASEETSHLTVEGVTLGTPEYMAPEVARASPNVDGRADLYALGCVGYVLLTGELVFDDSNPVSVALKHMNSPVVPPSQRTNRPVPLDLERVILSCLEKDPGARPPTARHVERMAAACDIPPWTDEDAEMWWGQHLPPAPQKA